MQSCSGHGAALTALIRRKRYLVRTSLPGSRGRTAPRVASHRGVRPGQGVAPPAADLRILADRVRGLPAQFAEPVVVNAEMVGDLVDNGAADLLGDLLLVAADRANRLPVDGDPVGQDPCVLRRAASERDALVQPEQPGGPGRCSTVTATLRISWPSSSGSPSSAVTTISSKRPGSTSITSPLSNAALPPQSALTQIARHLAIDTASMSSAGCDRAR